MGVSTEYIFGVYHTSWNLGNGSEWGFIWTITFMFLNKADFSTPIININNHYFEIYQNRWKISGKFLDPLGENLDFRVNYRYSKMHDFKYEFSKFFWGGPPRASSHASPSILGRFGSSVRAAPSIHTSNMFDNPFLNRGVLDQTRFSQNPNFLATP